MHAKATLAIALGATIGIWASAAGSARAARQGDTRSPGYTSTIQVQNHPQHQVENRDQGSDEWGEDRDEQREGADESTEAARLAGAARVDLIQAISAALAQVPGKALATQLDDENGRVVYSVEVRTDTSEVKDVKVDAGTGQVLRVDALDTDGQEEED